MTSLLGLDIMRHQVLSFAKRVVSTNVFLPVARHVHIAAPAKSAMDESIVVSVTGLELGQKVTISADAVRHSVSLSSFANYEAVDGTVNLAEAPSLGGTYQGIDAMGLFWSMDLSSKLQTVFKMVSGRVDYWPYTFKVFDGHAKTYDELRDETPLAERTIHRMFLPKGVHRVDVRFKDFRGYLFLPNGVGPYPAVIDIFGGAWGLVAHRGAMLARHGFAVLCVAYAAFDDLPKTLEVMDMGYFAKGYEYLAKHVPQIDGQRIGVMGSCLGGTLALSLAREVPQIRAVAVVSPEPIAGQWDYRFPSVGELVPGAEWATERVERNGAMYTDISQEKALIREGGIDKWEKFSLKYGKIRDAPVLIFYGSEDKIFDLKLSIPALRQQFADEKKQNYEIVLYNRAGHIIQPAYLPLFSRYYSPIFSSLVRYGGELPYHTFAQADMWRRCITFFKSHLQEAHVDDYCSVRPVNVRRAANGKIAPSDDLNRQFQVVDFEKGPKSSFMAQ